MNTTTAADRRGGRTRRFSPWLAVFTAAALAALLGLGTWQLHRLEWKEGLIAERTAGLSAPPLDIRDLPKDWAAARFHRVRAAGRFLHDREMLLVSRTFRGQAGYHVVTPFLLADGGSVLVDRGWVPLALAAPDSRPQGQMRGTVTIEGLLRAPGRPSVWTPDNDPSGGVWYYLDTAAMAEAAGLQDVRPFVIEAGPAPNPGGYPIGGQTRVDLPNNHLQYAITWYGLAAALAGVYIAFHFKRR